jgi:8-oxo-dGTP pyrophosphatase MutT (NUDIX family)
MKKHSCGAILYTTIEGVHYMILGKENGDWFPFKGTREGNETNEQAAIREVYEETCGLVRVSDITLYCHYSTKRKHYHIGLIYVDPDIISKFNKKRNNPSLKIAPCFIEKSEIALFRIDKLRFRKFHKVSMIPILFYMRYFP